MVRLIRAVRAIRAVILFGSAFLAASLPAAASTAELLADINLKPDFGSSFGALGLLVPLGDRLLFTAIEPSSGEELWISDGTPQGTRLPLDLAPGGESTRFFLSLGTVRSAAVLLRGGEFGNRFWDLWRSDGTPQGTFPIYPSTLESCNFVGNPPAVSAGNRLFFLAGGPSSRCGLWTTDGTAAGTRLVGEVDGEASELVAVANRVFFSTRNALWTSDGAATVLVRRFATVEDEGPRRLLAFGSRVAFMAQAVEGGGEELWTSDGTAAGTRALTRFFEPFPFGLSPLLKSFGQTLVFSADDGTGTDLWKIEGPTGTPRRMTDFIDREPFADGLGAGQIVQLGGRWVFPARDEGGLLWVSGGTPASTAPVSGCPGSCPSPWFRTPLIQLGSRIVFQTNFSGDRGEIWVTDGTGAGTRRLAGSSGYEPVSLLGKVFFIGPGSGRGLALWRTDGTAAGTIHVADLGENPFGGSFSLSFSPVAAGGRIFFLANLGSPEPQLWVSDGAPEGTRALSNIKAFPGSFPLELTPFAAGALFSAFDGRERKLWYTDGTPAGTVPLRAVNQPFAIVPAAGGVAFILAGYDTYTTYDGPFQVWRTDGTEAGTFRIDPPGLRPLWALAPFRSGAVFAVEAEDRISLWETDGTLAGTRPLFELPADVVRVRSLQFLGSRLYFVANREPFPSADELWISDGTLSGTRSLTPEGSLQFPLQPLMKRIGETVYFADEFGLWKTDGTADGTAELPLPQPGFEASRPTDLTELQGALYFMAWTPESPTSRGLWRSDGTPAGTVLVKAVGVPLSDASIGEPVRMARLGDRLVFAADDGVHGAELWSSDGTAAGTVLVRDIAPGEASSLSPLSSLSSRESLAVARGKAFFAATDGASGFELWESDGTAAGTRRVQDIAPGAPSSHPSALSAAADRLFFAADDGVHGSEPWVLPLEGEGCTPSAVALCLGGRFRVEADWRDFQGNRGRGRAVPLTADTGTFWFFDAANVEVILKVLDGRGVNGHHWVYYGALSNVEYTLTVTDTQSGAVRRYFNPPGWLGSLADVEAFGPRGASVADLITDGPRSAAGSARVAARSAPVKGSCAPGPERLCLNGNRFAVEARWRLPSGATGAGRAVPLAGGETGYFWFFDASNVEVVLKVLDGRPLTGKFWVFYGALSDVEYTLTVTDTESGAVKTYTNPRGRLASVADTGAF